MKNRESGMGLMEVMIAGAIGIGIAFAIMSMLQQTQKATKGVMVSSDWTALRDNIAQTLRNFQTCDTIMYRLGAEYDLALNAQANYDRDHAVSVPALRFEVGPSVQTLVEANKGNNGLVITDIKLWAISNPELVVDVSTTITYSKNMARIEVNAQLGDQLKGSLRPQKLSPLTVDFMVLTNSSTGTPPFLIRGCVPPGL